uniref:Peptidase S1 domain-containing protein n=1 Tax=Anopheles atroparvus TaxID=41427 RepID=A0AAG5DLJ9_ANOAO
MQISATIMRLVVVLSVLVQIYADTVSGPVPLAVTVSVGTQSPLAAGRIASERTPGRSMAPLEPGAVGPAPERRPSGQAGFRSERNVYRTKLSKLRLILLADMLNEIPPPQLELITCLANSSTLNVTTKHCDCEAYSCKDLLASSTPSPFNLIQPKRKIHTSCREHCCRKKKFNRSIDPAALENVVVSSLTSSSSPASSSSSSLSPSAAATSSRQRYNTVTITSPAHRSPSVSTLAAGSSHSNRLEAVESTYRRPTGPPSSGSVRDHRDRTVTAGRESCSNDGTDQISISNNRTIIPWLYRVGLIETKHPLCVGALIHPSLILTTAVCVINKTPEKLLVWNGAGSDGADSGGTSVSRIILPEQYATTFQRLENNVALLVLGSAASPKDKQPPPGWHESPTDTPVSIGTGPLRAWTVSARDGAGDTHSTTPAEEPEWRRRLRNRAKTELFERTQRKRTPVPAFICLSSIIDQTRPDRASYGCRTVSFSRQKLPDESGRSTGTPPPSERPNEGTNYVTTNISIFPATECRPEHQEYLQHDGNLCAGYGAARNRSIDVEYSGSPLICDELQHDGKVHRTVRGLLTWSTDINHAPHLFTNLTTYRPWIEREIERLQAAAEPQRPVSPPSGPIILRSVPYAQPRVPSVLYG